MATAVVNTSTLNDTAYKSLLDKYVTSPDRSKHVDQILLNDGALPEWLAEQRRERCSEATTNAEKLKILKSGLNNPILVVGAGGLGCEILPNLALSGFTDIHVIDMDTIDLSNLNRQFLFRARDIGSSKALTTAKFVEKRAPGCSVTAWHCRIQDVQPEYEKYYRKKAQANDPNVELEVPDFYMQFPIIICGLDSIDARRWMNAKVISMFKENEGSEDGFHFLIDGGTEGFRGQSRVIMPGMTSCYECSLDMLTPPTVFPICTIANTPRLPEHCIEWASVLEWPKVFPDKKMDKDDPEHITWLYDVASKRAADFKIEGVTWSLTQGVVKNIIPAIASTNAIIAASCVNEALKFATSSGTWLNNYMMMAGTEGVYSYTFEHQRKEDCVVCGGESRMETIADDTTLGEFIEYLEETLKVKKPSLSIAGSGMPLYFQRPPALESQTRPNLEKAVKSLVPAGHDVTVTSVTLPVDLSILIEYSGQLKPRKED